METMLGMNEQKHFTETVDIDQQMKEQIYSLQYDNK